MQTAVTASPAAESKPLKRAMQAIALLAILGVAVSSFSLYHHFSRAKTEFCDIGQSFNCDLVNRSPYSVVVGVPVALIGILGYLMLLAFATVYRDKAETPVMLLIASVGGLAFALRLAYIEAFVLHAWCLLCLSSLAVVLVIFVMSVVAVSKFVRRA